jgi:hypothetical protein
MKKLNARKIVGAAMLMAIMLTSAGCYPYWWRHDYNRRDDYRRSDRYDRYDWRGDNDRWDRDRYR